MRDAFRVAGQVPLTTLLSWAWIAFTIEADNAVEAAASGGAGRLFRISMPMWANGLRFIDSEGITVGELQARARAACNIGGLERWGWITVGDPGAGRRDGYGSHRGVRSDTVLRATRAGRRAHPARWLLARPEALPRADTTHARRPGRGAAMAPDGAAPWRMARWFLGPRSL
jgi:hypothetical protein